MVFRFGQNIFWRVAALLTLLAVGGCVAHALDKLSKPGDRLRVSGKLAAPNNQIVIEPHSIEFLGTATTPAPQEVRTGFVGPATEGRLIAVHGTIIREVDNDL